MSHTKPLFLFLIYSNPSKDCSQVLARGVTMSGMYTVKPLDSSRPLQVDCDMDTDGGGWTVRHVMTFITNFSK